MIEDLVNYFSISKSKMVILFKDAFTTSVKQWNQVFPGNRILNSPLDNTTWGFCIK